MSSPLTSTQQLDQSEQDKDNSHKEQQENIDQLDTKLENSDNVGKNETLFNSELNQVTNSGDHITHVKCEPVQTRIEPLDQATDIQSNIETKENVNGISTSDSGVNGDNNQEIVLEKTGSTEKMKENITEKDNVEDETPSLLNVNDVSPDDLKEGDVEDRCFKQNGQAEKSAENEQEEEWLDILGSGHLKRKVIEKKCPHMFLCPSWIQSFS